MLGPLQLLAQSLGLQAHAASNLSSFFPPKVIYLKGRVESQNEEGREGESEREGMNSICSLIFHMVTMVRAGPGQS